MKVSFSDALPVTRHQTNYVVVVLDMNYVIDNENDDRTGKDLLVRFRLEQFEREKLSSLWNQCCDTVAVPEAAVKGGVQHAVAILPWKSLHNTISLSPLTESILSDANIVDCLEHIWNHTTESVTKRVHNRLITTKNMPHGSSDSNTDAIVHQSEEAEFPFQQSGTFGVFLETVASVCGRLPLPDNNNDVLDALWTTAAAAAAAAQPEQQIHECLADLVYRLCHHATSSPVCHQTHELQNGASVVERSKQAPASCPDRSPAAWRHLLASSNIVSSILETAETLGAQKWRQWAQRQIPAVTHPVYTLFYTLLLREPTRDSPHQLHFRYPSMAPKKKETTLSDTTNEPSGLIESFLPQCTLMGIFSPVTDQAPSLCPLFQSCTDGFSMHTLAKALTTKTDMLGQPTILLIQTMRNEWLGYFTPVPWTMSSSGGATHQSTVDSFLFRLYPEWNIYRPISESSFEASNRGQGNHVVPDTNDAPWIQRNRQNPKVVQYLNFPLAQQQACRSVTLPVGLVVGAPDQPRLHLTPDLEECLAQSFDAIFDPGPLLSDASDTMGRFDVANLEVWAVSGGGDDQIRDRAHVIASLQERVRQQCAKVDRAQFLDDFQTGLYENSLFQHRIQARGRADFFALDDRPGYFVDGKVPSSQKSDGAS
jgi:TLD